MLVVLLTYRASEAGAAGVGDPTSAVPCLADPYSASATVLEARGTACWADLFWDSTTTMSASNVVIDKNGNTEKARDQRDGRGYMQGPRDPSRRALALLFIDCALINLPDRVAVGLYP